MELVQVKEKERIDDLQIKEYRIIQKTDGFCFGIDAVLLSDYAKVKRIVEESIFVVVRGLFQYSWMQSTRLLM